MNQAFFTLSLGIGAMEIFGSYMSRENTLTSEAVRICALDTFVAIMRGADYFPRLLFLRRLSGCQAQPDFHHPAAMSSPAWRAAACGERCSSCS